MITALTAADNVRPDTCPGFDVVALAASAGGFRAVGRVLAELPADFPAAVLFVQHLSPDHPSHLPDLLARQTRLSVKAAAAGDPVRPGTVFVAPPGRHLVMGPGGRLDLSDAPRVHFCRPAADVLFRSMAVGLGARAVAAVLTGTGRDGADGVRAVRRAGGFTIAQDAATAEQFGMPATAIETRHVDLVLPLDRMAFALVTLVQGPVAALRLEIDLRPVGRGGRS